VANVKGKYTPQSSTRKEGEGKDFFWGVRDPPIRQLTTIPSLLGLRVRKGRGERGGGGSYSERNASGNCEKSLKKKGDAGRMPHLRYTKRPQWGGGLGERGGETVSLGQRGRARK